MGSLCHTLASLHAFPRDAGRQAYRDTVTAEIAGNFELIPFRQRLNVKAPTNVGRDMEGKMALEYIKIKFDQVLISSYVGSSADDTFKFTDYKPTESLSTDGAPGEDVMCQNNLWIGDDFIIDDGGQSNPNETVLPMESLLPMEQLHQDFGLLV